MRSLILIAFAGAMTACSTSPPTSSYAGGEERLAALLAEKVAGQSVNCVPNFRTSDGSVLTDTKIAFEDGPARVYVSDIKGTGCEGLASPTHSLTTRSTGTGLCRGDTVHVVDRQIGTALGTCTLSEFTPYSRS